MSKMDHLLIVKQKIQDRIQQMELLHDKNASEYKGWLEAIDEVLEDDSDEPERPTEKPKTPAFYKPEIYSIRANVKTHGRYRTSSGKPKGLVVHFTAGWRENPNPKQAAINTLKDMAGRGLGCLVMDMNGEIYMDSLQDFDETAYHAGKSTWKGVTGLSRYCMGMEICNAGVLNKDGKAWFGKQYNENEIRTVSKKDNIAAATYLKYTQAQEDALTNFCLWQLKTNPEFDVDWVVGHDEISPGRKVDPGGALSMTMPEFRLKLRKLAK